MRMNRVVRIVPIVIGSLWMFSCAPHDYPYRIYSHQTLILENAKIVVFPFPSSSNEISFLAADLVSQNLLRKGFRVLDRSNLTSILQEQGLSISGLAEEPDYKKIGKLLDSDFIVVGVIKIGGNEGGRKRTDAITDVSIRLIEIRTGEILKGGTYRLETDSRGNLEPSHSKPLAVICENLIDYLLGAPMPKLFDHKDPDQQ